ncbi:hypothetical protein BD779DRAFT_343384 [Infundibulicybe gibba]|nr:hypothetical protein BD779DRAFT_343384 [Infundibulicybe gibba]
MGKIIGLLVPFTQIQQVHAFNICYTIAEKAGARWVPVDYPAGSKQACIILPLYERDDTQPLRMKRWAASECVAKARAWLKKHGISYIAIVFNICRTHIYALSIARHLLQDQLKYNAFRKYQTTPQDV